jgi:Domain related to MnhB subunit of Na+/H+ antiporter
MRYGAQTVARVLTRRVIALLVVLGCVALVGDPRGGGVQAGALLAAALIVHAVTFGVAATVRAASPTTLRTASALGVLLVIAAGVWAARGDAFAFIVSRVGGFDISLGGALTHLGAALTVAGAGAFIFVCIAGRATAIGDAPGEDR